MNHNSYRHLFKNVGILTISSFSSKLLSILILPLYTNILSTGEYGTYDLYATTVPMIFAILTCNVCEPVLRFALDESKDKRDVFSIGIRRCFLSSLFFTAVVLLLRGIPFFFDLIKFPLLLIGYYWALSFYETITRFVRGLDKIRAVAVGGVIGTASLLVSVFLFLYVFHWRLTGYFLAVYLSLVLPLLYYCVRLRLWNYFTFRHNPETNRLFFRYGFPLVFDSAAWWVNVASDRYVVTWICGIAVNGVYSIAYKLPSILNSIQSVFSQAWVISAVQEYENHNFEFIKKTYNVYNTLLVLISTVLLVFNKIIAGLLFAGDYYSAWVFAPFLTVAAVFGSLSNFEEGIFVAAKNSKTLAVTTMTGAAINIILNIFTVKQFGAIGAAVSTLISYIFVWLMRTVKIKPILCISIVTPRQLLCLLLLVIQAFLCSFRENAFFISLSLTAAILVINYKDILNITRSVTRIVLNSRK